MTGIADGFHGVCDNFLSIVYIPRTTSITYFLPKFSKATLGCIFYDLMQFGDYESFLQQPFQVRGR